MLQIIMKSQLVHWFLNNIFIVFLIFHRLEKWSIQSHSINTEDKTHLKDRQICRRAQIPVDMRCWNYLEIHIWTLASIKLSHKFPFCLLNLNILREGLRSSEVSSYKISFFKKVNFTSQKVFVFSIQNQIKH
jgi:hypothetical protein